MMHSPKSRLIIFTRPPWPGRAKTRLIPALGPDGAASLQKKMTEHIVRRARQSGISAAVSIAFSDGVKADFQKWLGGDLRYLSQGDGDLGRRMLSALTSAFNSGAGKAVILGADIPGLSGRVMASALTALDTDDLVFGPATDGGYYLVGANRAAFSRGLSGIFTGIAWGGNNVLDASLANAAQEGFSFRLLEVLSDVDVPEDLPVWAKRPKIVHQHQNKPLISIIIPALNEADHIEQTIQRTLPADNVEVILADGGSRDNTVRIAGKYGVRVIKSLPGRARQMNAGAAAATGSILLFLHGDTLVSAGFDGVVRSALKNDRISVGAFSLGFMGDKAAFRLVAWGANRRTRLFGLPYGDQAIFMRRNTFWRLGGFPDIPVMEDFQMMRRAKRLGRIVLLPEKVKTSPRRWERLGVFRTTMINQLVIAGYLLGISPNRLAMMYQRKKSGPVKAASIRN